MANSHRLLSPKDCEYYIMRLDALPKKFDQTLEGLKVREQKQILPPRFVSRGSGKRNERFHRQAGFGKYSGNVVQNARGQDRQVDRTATSRFSGARGKRHHEPGLSGLSEADRLFPELEPKTTTDDGVWKLPDGDAFYAYILRDNTTTNMPPNEVHDLGLREVARIEGEMRTLLDANGFAGQPIGASMDKLGKDPRFLYSNDDKGREAALADYKRLLDNATAHCSELFITFPKAKIDIRRVPAVQRSNRAGRLLSRRRDGWVPTGNFLREPAGHE